jgi:hypothetical protein
MSTVPQRYLQIMQSIEQIAHSCGREPQEILLVAVSKSQPVSKILEAYEAGCRDIGESRVQESLHKLPDLPQDLNMHLIGTLQKNKVNHAVGNYSLIHSVENLDLAKKISEASLAHGLISSVLLQANTSGEQSKHGLSPAQWAPFFDELLQLQGIRLEGLMTIAPLTSDENIIRKCFADLRVMREAWQSQMSSPSHFKHLSMGMSSDYALAIQEGATILRIGTAIFRGS